MLARLSSVTAAVKIKRLLKKKGINTDVVQAPSKIWKGGCGYALKFRKEYLSSVEKAAADIGTKIIDIYDETLGE